MALFALRTYGRLQVSELLTKLRAFGWKGSGDDRKDRNAIYAALHRRSDAAFSCGGGLWAAKVSDASAINATEHVHRSPQAAEGSGASPRKEGQ